MTALHHIQAILGGQKDAFSHLVDANKGMVYSICLKVLKDQSEAEDAAQESFIKAFKRLNSFDQQANFGTWMYSIAYRTAIDRYRQIKRKMEVSNELGQTEMEDSFAGPVQGKEELKHWLNLSMKELEEEDRMVLELFYLKEMSVKEVAEITGFSESNVKVKLFRSREKLRKKMLKLLGKEVYEL